MERRLAAIMAADVVGYSRLIRADEEGTIAALQVLRADLIDPKLDEHNGRIVKLMGDGMLAEFPSVVDAVRAAIETQQAVADHNSVLPENKRIEFRVGINLGDVVIDGDDIQGDGVNVAARLEGLAEPGGICISGSVYEQVRDRIDLPFKDLGEQKVKNIGRPIQVWRWSPDQPATTPAVDPTAQPVAVADKPAIAVLPFTNMSADPEQEYFADGIAEDIITGLSRFRNFLVIARNTTFTYKGQAVDVAKVSRDLHARYVVEGSVRKSGNRIRVTAQLIDGDSGTHIWAERYDGVLEDIFDLQDEITSSIVSAVAPQSLHAEVRRASDRRDADLGTWELLMQARWHMGRYNREDATEAIRIFQEVIARDSGNVQALGWLALMNSIRARFGWAADPAAARAESLAAAQQAVSLDAMDAMGHAIAGFMLLWDRRFEEAVASCRRAVELNPNLALGHGLLAATLGISGHYEEALPALHMAKRLSPLDPELSVFKMAVGLGAFAACRYEDVLRLADEVITANPNLPPPHRQKAAAYAMLDRLDEAQREIERLLDLMPDLTLAKVRQFVPTPPEATERHIEALRKAGLPE